MANGVDQGHILFYTKMDIYFRLQCRKVLVVCTFGYVEVCFSKNIQLCSHTC